MDGRQGLDFPGPDSQTHFYFCYSDLGHLPIVPRCSPSLLLLSTWFHNLTSSRRQVPCIQQHYLLCVMMRAGRNCQGEESNYVRARLCMQNKGRTLSDHGLQARTGHCGALSQQVSGRSPGPWRKTGLLELHQLWRSEHVT